MKTEKEKMLAGEAYDAYDKALVKDRIKARNLTYAFNRTKPDRIARKVALIKQLINAKGTFRINAPFFCDYGYNITLGNGFYANCGCTLLDVAEIVIGDNVMLGPHVQIYTAGHPTDPGERLQGLEYGKKITIGNNVWIGGGAILCPGVTVGNNVTIGAGSVVTHDIPDNVVAVGNPCKVIKKVD